MRFSVDAGRPRDAAGPVSEGVNVTSSLSYPRADSAGYRKHSVNLGDGDLVRLVVEGRIKGYTLQETDGEVRIIDESGERLSTLDAYRVLQAYADILVWMQTYAEGAATKEYVEEKIRECRERARILLA